MKNMIVRFVALFCFLVTAAEAARAEGFGLYEYSARGISLGGAMMARKPDPSVVAYNPALLTRLPGMHAMVGASLINPYGEMDWKDAQGNRGNTELRDSVWAIPHAYFTWQINDDWFFGIGEFTRFGLGFEYPHEWPGRFNIYEVALKSGSLNPNIAWKATEKLSVAAGVELVYVDLDIKKRAKIQAHPQLPDYFEIDSNIHKAQDFGVGANVALHYQFSDQWAAGIQYRSPARVHAHGDVMFSFKEATLISGMITEAQMKNGYDATFKDGTAHSIVTLPESVQMGIAWTPIPELSFEVDALWTRWSRFRHLNIHLPHGLPTSQSNKHWEDTWRLSAGIEYDVNDWLTLRGGYVYDQSPMTEYYADYLVPTADRHIYSVGVGLKYEAWTLDLAYAYIDAIGRSYRAKSETYTLDSSVKSSATNIFSVSLSYAF